MRKIFFEELMLILDANFQGQNLSLTANDLWCQLLIILMAQSCANEIKRAGQITKELKIKIHK